MAPLCYFENLGRTFRENLLDAQGGFKLQFKVNGQDYFLNFVEDEGRWYVFAPTSTGVQRIPIYVDVPKYERYSVLEKGRHKTQN